MLRLADVNAYLKNCLWKMARKFHGRAGLNCWHAPYLKLYCIYFICSYDIDNISSSRYFLWKYQDTCLFMCVQWPIWLSFTVKLLIGPEKVFRGGYLQPHKINRSQKKWTSVVCGSIWTFFMVWRFCYFRELKFCGPCFC